MNNGAVAHLHNDGESFLALATWEPADEVALPDRGALEEIVSADIERMAAIPLGRAMLTLRTFGGGVRLVYHAGQTAFEREAKRLVIVADPECHAIRIDESLGFVAAERQVQLTRRPAVA